MKILSYWDFITQAPFSLQEKQKHKVREKFDKCNKEKLLELCDVLDIPVVKATTRKVCLVIFVAPGHLCCTILAFLGLHLGQFSQKKFKDNEYENWKVHIFLFPAAKSRSITPWNRNSQTLVLSLKFASLKCGFISNWIIFLPISYAIVAYFHALPVFP